MQWPSDGGLKGLAHLTQALKHFFALLRKHHIGCRISGFYGFAEPMFCQQNLVVLLIEFYWKWPAFFIGCEVSLKSTLLHSTLRLKVAASISEIKNFQCQYQLPNGGSSVSNEGAVEVSGVDLSLQALSLDNLT